VTDNPVFALIAVWDENSSCFLGTDSEWFKQGIEEENLRPDQVINVPKARGVYLWKGEIGAENTEEEGLQTYVVGDFRPAALRDFARFDLVFHDETWTTFAPKVNP
jgi:hypothetical protein